MKKFLLLLFLMTFSLGQSQTAAPTQPARNSWDVISVFSGAYADLPGTDFNPNWGQSGFGFFSTPSYGGDPVKEYGNLNYQGTQTQSDMDVSAINKLHIDIYSPTLTSIRLSVIKITAGTVERPITLPLTAGSWNSFDIDLTQPAFAGLDLTRIRQFKYDQASSNGQTLIVDNIYFWRDATLLPPTVGPFTVPSQAVGAAPFTLTPPTSENTSPFTYNSSNTNVATIAGDVVTIVGAGTTTITALQVSDGSYGPSSTPATLTVSYPAPGPSPTPPARDPGSVISMYTGNPPTYADPVGFNMVRSPWTGGTASDLNFANGSDTCIKLENFGFFGFVTSTEPVRFSVEGMSKLHVDVYLNTPLANMFVYLLSNGDQNYNTGPLVAGWNSLDISLSNYPGADLASIYGFKFEHNQPGLRQIYLDNIYFYAGGTEPTITDFTVPAKVFGDAPFTLTAPTSDSGGAFTYSSSNHAVATVAGDVVTVTGVGTCNIIATQAPDGSFDAGSISAPLVVSAPPLATAAPTPPARNTWDVVSLYSNAYTNLPSVAWQGASTLTDEVLEGNDTKKMSDFLLEFINFSAVDVSEMTMLHMDIYTPDCPGFNIWLLNNGDRNAQIFPAINGWRSIDIPLSTYANNGLIMSAIRQIKFESLSGPGKTVYVDNVYFYRPATLFPATVGTFTVPAKNLGDADFTLTPPSSNNTSPFTYTSSNPNVATIVNGDQIHIVGGGISTITASQVSDGSYGPTIRTASFVVSFPAPGPSPIPPARDPSRVISMFTGTPSTYANPVGFEMVRSPWTGGTTLTEVPNGDNTCLKVDNLGFLGYVTSTEPTRFSVEGMTHLHLDVYVNEPFSNLFFWLLTDGDQRRDITNLVTGWNSIDIDLTEFAGANLANVYGFKFEQNQPTPIQIYLDNIYFSNETYYADTDGDGFGDLASPALGEQPGYVGNSTDCDDSNIDINPGVSEVCYNNIDDNCSGASSEGCLPVVVNMPSSLNNSTLVSLATAIPAVPYSYGGFTNIKYRFSITNTTTGVTAPDIIQISRFVTIPAAIHTHGASYTITASAVINEEIVPFAGNTITVNSPAVPVITLSSSTCGATLATLASSLTANPGLNATGYTFRIRLNDSNPSPTYYTSSSATRFVGANTFAGFPLQYGSSYRVAVQYTFTDPVSSLPVDSGYGAECVVNTPSIPVTSMASPSCGGTVSALNANMAARAASYATGYKFRIRLFSDNGPTPTYYETAVLPSRFSSLTAFQGFAIAYNTEYAISVQYSVLNGMTTEWSAFGPDCKVTTPFFPTTSLVPSQCGLMTATSLTQQLNITPYPGFPNYKVLLEEVDGETVVTSEEREIVYSNFKLSDFAIAQLGKSYNVSVAIKLNGVFGDYSTACDLFTEEAAPSKAMVQTPFTATAYPNPFANNFMLDVKTSSQSSVSVKVYDMVGRLIEQKEVSISDMESTTIGNQYPSGVYNVVIAQEDSLQTLRVIKR